MEPVKDQHLEEPCASALRECVTWVRERYDVLGLIAAGTIIAGDPDPASDLDIYVIHSAPTRQRIQRLFNGLPCEIFVNPPGMIRKYFQWEYDERRPSTAHMVATGRVIVDADPIVGELVAEAREWLEKKPNVTAKLLNDLKYGAATLLEDAVDLERRDPAAAAWTYARTVEAILDYVFSRKGVFIPRPKELFRRAKELDEDIGTLAARVVTVSDSDRRREAAFALADRTIGVYGFYEWESEPEDVDIQRAEEG